MNGIDQIVNDLPELMNYPTNDRSFYEKVAEKWVRLGFSGIEVWDWMCNGYDDPERVLYLNRQGQNVLHIDDFVHTLIRSEYGHLADVCLKEDMYTIELELVRVHEKEKGVGTSILKDICSLADILRKNVRLTPTDEFGSDFTRLTKFYERFGFSFEINLHRHENMMIRKFQE